MGFKYYDFLKKRQLLTFYKKRVQLNNQVIK